MTIPISISIGLALLAGCILIMHCLCRVAADADQQAEEIAQQLKQKQDNENSSN